LVQNAIVVTTVAVSEMVPGTMVTAAGVMAVRAIEHRGAYLYRNTA
jgi:hypothetical protein